MEQSEPSAFGILLRRHRMAVWQTQEQLSEKAGVSARTISDIERGIARRPQTHTALQLADALGLEGEDRRWFLNAARGRQIPQPARDAGGNQETEPAGAGSTLSPLYGEDNGAVAVTAEPDAIGTGVLPFPGSRPARPRSNVSVRTVMSIVLVAAVVAAVALLATRQFGVGDSQGAHSTAARPAVISSWGSRITGPFPLPHMWNITVLPNGRFAVITYQGVDDYPVEKGVDELSPSGDLLWSWAVHSNRNSGLSGLAGDASGNLYLAARYWKQIDKFSPDGRLVARWGPRLGLKGPTRIALDSHGNVWVLDFDASRILKLSPAGKLLAEFGSAGHGVGQFTNPDGLAFGRNGNLYVVDWTLDRVTEYSPEGTPVRTWGGTGSGPSQFLSPRSLATDAAGNVYVADSGNARIEKFTPGGRLLATWGTRGTRPGQFSYPVGVFVAPNGKVYVADDGHSHYCGCFAPDRIEIFSRSGRFLSQIPATVLRKPMLSDVTALAVDARGNVYATDAGTGRIVAFGANHLPIHGWERNVNTGGPLTVPDGIAVDSVGNVLVSDSAKNRLVRFAPGGHFLQQWKSINYTSGALSDPFGIAVGAAGDVFVADDLSQRVEELSPNGKLLRSWSATFSNSDVPTNAIATDVSGDVYVGNETSMTVDRYTSSGKYVSSVGGQGESVGSLRSISGVAVDSRGRVYAVDHLSRAVVVFSPSGTLLARWTAARFPRLGTPRAIAIDHSGNIYIGGSRQIVELATLS